MHTRRAVPIGVFGIFAIGVLLNAVSSIRDMAPVRPVLARMLALENPLVVPPRVLPFGKSPPPGMKHRWRQMEHQAMARTFAPGSPVISRNLHIFYVDLKSINTEKGRIGYRRIQMPVESLVALGPWARATILFSAQAHPRKPAVNGIAGTAYLRRITVIGA